jgi:alkylation response protein AidB-like acyl-CoA dehydrogenase
MRFALTDDQIAFGDATRDLLAKESPDAERTYDALVAMGVTQVLVPESEGGLGMDEVAATVILEHAGYAGVSFPIIVPVMGTEVADALSLGAAAQLVGLGQRMLDMTVDHVKAREQFGVAIGSFQAVKHHLADALMELSYARPAVHRAAWSMANGAPTAERDVSMAKAMASDAASFVARQALQCHGAIGYTVEYDLHRFLKRTWVLARTFGDAAWHRERIARALEI